MGSGEGGSGRGGGSTALGCAPRSDFFNFHAVFLVKNLQNNRFEYPTLGLTPNQYKPSDFKCDVTKGRLMGCSFCFTSTLFSSRVCVSGW